MKNILLFILLFLSISCNSVSESNLAELNGYWEIKEAILADGTKKEYTINPTIDYFQIVDKKGFRYKVMPQLDGTYLKNDLSERIEVIKENDKFYISYSTVYAQWKEEIVKLTDKELVLKNNHNMQYHYIKPELFTIK